MTDLLESLDELLPGLLTSGQLFVDIFSQLLDLVPNVFPGLTLEFTRCEVLGGLLALLVEVCKVDTLLLLLFRWSRLVGGILGIVGDGNGSIGKDVSREENDIGTDLSEFRRGDYQAGNGSERLDRSLRVLGELFSSCGYRSGVDVNVDVGVGSVVLDCQLVERTGDMDPRRSSARDHHRSSRLPKPWKLGGRSLHSRGPWILRYQVAQFGCWVRRTT